MVGGTAPTSSPAAAEARGASPAGGDAPLVSLGLPVYNGARFLPACLDSLVRQTYPAVEIVISDNGSTDDTPRICEEFARRDSRIRVVREDRNRGAAWNHRRVLALAHGTYFKWCGADDMCDPAFVVTCMNALAAEPRAVVAYPRTIVIDSMGLPIQRTTERRPVDSPDPVVRFRSLQRSLPVTYNMLYGVIRTEYLRRARPLGAFLAADRCLAAELALLGPFVEVPAYLMFRRLHTGNAVRSADQDQRVLDPNRPRRPWPREWRVCCDHLVAVTRCPLGPAQKLRLLRAEAAWMLTMRAQLWAEAREFAGGWLRGRR